MKKESHLKKLNEMSLEKLSTFEEYTVKDYIALFKSDKVQENLNNLNEDMTKLFNLMSLLYEISSIKYRKLLTETLKEKEKNKSNDILN